MANTTTVELPPSGKVFWIWHTQPDVLSQQQLHTLASHIEHVYHFPTSFLPLRNGTCAQLQHMQYLKHIICSV